MHARKCPAFKRAQVLRRGGPAVRNTVLDAGEQQVRRAFLMVNPNMILVRGRTPGYGSLQHVDCDLHNLQQAGAPFCSTLSQLDRERETVPRALLQWWPGGTAGAAITSLLWLRYASATCLCNAAFVAGLFWRGFACVQQASWGLAQLDKLDMQYLHLFFPICSLFLLPPASLLVC